jgi:NADH-quinone oxidoreductase subunit C
MPEVKELLTTKFGVDAFPMSDFRENRRVVVPAAKLFDVMTVLKNDGGFDYLVDVTGIDYLHYPNATDRYHVVYSLANTETGKRVFVKVALNDPDPKVASVYPLWKGADWMEREVFDMFGIDFIGHPDLRRILMPEGFESFPLRKDYPLRGKGERHNFETVTRAES